MLSQALCTINSNTTTSYFRLTICPVRSLHKLNTTPLKQPNPILTRLTRNMRNWLDAYPSHGIIARNEAARLKNRVNTISNALEQLKWKIDIRQHLIALVETNGQYCPTCSQTPKQGYCGPTCPLHRTGDLWHRDDKKWVNLAKQDVRIYGQLTRDIQKYGMEANRQTVGEWEATLEVLLAETEDPKYQMLRPAVNYRVFQPNWNFRDHWGKGPGLEEKVAPDEMPPSFEAGAGGKRKRGD